MATLARMHKQRKVNRASWKVRFTQQRLIRRGSAGVATALAVEGLGGGRRAVSAIVGRDP